VNLAAVYSREIDGRVLTIAPSGWTYDNTFVLYDRETGSLWYPDGDDLLGIQGVYFQRRLSRVPSRDTEWWKWEKEFPDSRILK
jgi:hypothetical protein